MPFFFLLLPFGRALVSLLACHLIINCHHQSTVQITWSREIIICNGIRRKYLVVTKIRAKIQRNDGQSSFAPQRSCPSTWLVRISVVCMSIFIRKGTQYIVIKINKQKKNVGKCTHKHHCLLHRHCYSGTTANTNEQKNDKTRARKEGV